MNKKRKARIQKLIDQTEAFKAELEAIQEEEQDYLSNIPENLQGSARAENAEEVTNVLDYAYDNLSELSDNLELAIE